MSRSIPLSRLFIIALIIAVLATASTVQSGGAQLDGKAIVQSNALAPNVPIQVFPKGIVPIQRIIYTWTSVSGATKYQIQVYRGTTTILFQGYTSTICASGTCSFRHNINLPKASYSWRVRAMIGGSWQTFSPWQGFAVSSANTGFFSPFTSNALHRMVHKGLWSPEDSNYITTVGAASKASTISHINDDSALTYKVRMRRTGCAGCANVLIIRGNPVNDTVGWRNTEYTFNYTNSGLFSVWRDSYGTNTALLNWTSTTAINQNGWNLLEVTANGSTLRFYINSQLVWSRIDSAYPSGRVGTGMYRGFMSTGDKLYVDYAQLEPFVADPAADMLLAEIGEEMPGGDKNLAP